MRWQTAIRLATNSLEKQGGHKVSLTHRPARIAGGSRPPVVFLVHGMADTSASWSSILSGLEHCDVWLFDMPWSGVNGADWAAVQSAGDWWYDALALCPATPDCVIGHSFGTSVLLDWALRRAPSEPPCQLLLASPLYLPVPPALSWDAVDAFARSVPAQLSASIMDRADREVAPRVGGARSRMMDATSGVTERFPARSTRNT